MRTGSGPRGSNKALRMYQCPRCTLLLQSARRTPSASGAGPLTRSPNQLCASKGRGVRRVAPAGRACADAQARGRHTHRSTMRTVVDAAWRQRVTDHLPPPSEPAAYAPCLHAWTLGGGGVQFRQTKLLSQRTRACLWYQTKKNPFYPKRERVPVVRKDKSGSGDRGSWRGQASELQEGGAGGRGQLVSTQKLAVGSQLLCTHARTHAAARGPHSLFGRF